MKTTILFHTEEFKSAVNKLMHSSRNITLALTVITTLTTGLWASNAASATPYLVKDINGISDSAPANLANANGILFFKANDGINGAELWKSDGTDTGTVLVKNINAGSSNPSSLIDVNGTLFFTASNNGFGIGNELWKSDGTPTGTVLVKNINAGSSSNPSNLTEVNGTLFFTANDGINGTELWKSDGTDVGTVLVKGINAVGNSTPSNLTSVNGTLFFTADDGINGIELWKSDGTPTGTVLVKNINAVGDSTPTKLININGTLFFAANDGINGNELWKSDGTKVGTVLVKDINPSGTSNPLLFTNVNGKLYFVAFGSGWGLWKSDGTDGGTVLVKGLSGNPPSLTHSNGTLFFRGFDATNGYGLWKSDGTDIGTVLVKVFNAGSLISSPANLTDVNGTLFFTADNGIKGIELWQSDGTPGGTFMVMDILPGSAGSSPDYLFENEGSLYFSADNGVVGTELWAYSPTNTPPTISQIADHETYDKNSIGPLSFSISDQQSTVDCSSIVATSSDEVLLSNNITIGGSGQDCKIDLVPENIAGISVVNLTLSDGMQTASMSFTAIWIDAEVVGSADEGAVVGVNGIEHTSISSAITAASAGDTIIVTDGVYSDINMDFGGIDITVRSENGAQKTTIDCKYSGRAFLFTGGETSAAVLQGFTIQNCEAPPLAKGGAIYIDGSSPSFIDNRFIRNYAEGGGGAIYSSGSSAGPLIDGNTFFGNSAGANGGAILHSGFNFFAVLTVKNCEFENNIAVSEGGAIKVGAFGISPSFNLDNSRFSLNRSDRGGAISISSNDMIITRSSFTRNTATSYGGAIEFRNNQSGSSYEISNSVFERNQAIDFGGALHMTGKVQVTNSSFYANKSNKGHAILFKTTTVGESSSIKNSIFWGDSSEPTGEQIDHEMTNSVPLDLSIGFSILQGGIPNNLVLTVDGPILDVDPLFALEGDLRVMPESPAIDAGTDSPTGILSETDHVGVDRSLDGNNDSLLTPDIGAFEFDPANQSNLAINSTHFRANAILNDSPPEALEIIFRNIGGGSTQWEISEDLSWLWADVEAGTASESLQSVRLFIDHRELEHDTYEGVVDIIDSNSGFLYRRLLVTLNVNQSLRVSVAEGDYDTIQEAIDVAIDGDTVLVPAGTYTLDDVNGLVRDKNLDPRGKAITIRSENGPEVTIIDCANAGRGFHLKRGEDRRTIIEGFTIKNGDPSVDPTPDDDDAWGGGIYAEPGVTASFVNLKFLDNKASEHGGGMKANGGVSIRNCEFVNNQTDVEGGGLYLLEGSYAEIVDSKFSANKASDGAGIHAFNGQDLKIINSEFRNNKAFDQPLANVTTNQGGGVRIRKVTRASLLNNIFVGNEAGVGGAIFSHTNDSLNIVNNLIYLNKAKNTSGLYGGGGIYANQGAREQVINSTLYDNTAPGNGQNIYIDVDNLTTENNVFTVINSILYQTLPAVGIDIETDVESHITISHSTTSSALGVFMTQIKDVNNVNTNNVITTISGDPRFFDVNGADDIIGNSDDDFRLDAASPSIDTGITVAGLFSDIRGSVRPVDGNTDEPDAQFDRGAYEFSDFYGGIDSDSVAKSLKNLRVNGAQQVVGFEYLIQWGDKDPFPAGDPRVSQTGEYDVNLALVSDEGLRVKLDTFTVTVSAAGYNKYFTFAPEHIGNWKLRVELVSDPNQFFESDDVFIRYKEVTEYDLGTEIIAPAAADRNQKPEVDNDAIVYWSTETNRLYAVGPGTTVVTWYEDERRENPIPVVAQFVYPSDPQLHIADTQAVTLLPAGSPFDAVENKYSDNDSSIAGNNFTATGEGWAVLLFRDSDNPDLEKREMFEVVRTYTWNHKDDLEDKNDSTFPVEKTAFIGKAISDDGHDAVCDNGYVFFEDGFYDGLGVNKAYDRDIRQGPIFAVNLDLTGNITSLKSPQDDLLVVWYKQSTISNVCWPENPVRYDAQWPTDAKTIVIASTLGSGPLDPETYGLSSNMVIYNQPDRLTLGYNPNEEHAAFFTAQGSTYPGIFPLRSDLNKTDPAEAQTSESYTLLKYRKPLTNEWNMEVFKVVASSESYHLDAGSIVAGNPNDDRYCLNSNGAVITQADCDSHTIIVANGQTEFTLPYYESDPANSSLIVMVTLNGNPLVDSENYSWVFDVNNHPKVTITDSLSNGDELKYVWLEGATYYLGADGYLVNPDSTTGCYEYSASGVIGGTIDPQSSCLATDVIETYYLTGAGVLQLKTVPAANEYSMDQHGLLVDSGLYFRFHYNSTAGSEINLPYPLNQFAFGPCTESYITPSSVDKILRDKDNKKFAYYGDVDVKLHYFYKLQADFYFPEKTVGSCIAWLEGLDGTFDGVEPVETTYAIDWPAPVPSLFVGETLVDAKTQTGEPVGLPNIGDQCQVNVLYDQPIVNSGMDYSKYSVNLIDPLTEYSSTVYTFFANPEADLPQTLKPKKDLSTGRWVFTALPYHLQSRLTWDEVDQQIKLKGNYSSGVGEPFLLMNILTDRDLAIIETTLIGEDNTRKIAFDLLVEEANNAAVAARDYPVTEYTSLKDAELKALTAGDAHGTGYVTLAFNNHADCPAPTVLSVISVTGPLYEGDIKVIESPNPFEEKVTLKHNGDFGGNADDRDFQWKYTNADFSGIPCRPEAHLGDPESCISRTWLPYEPSPTADELTPSIDANPFYVGAADTVIQGSGQQLLPDKWFAVRYNFENLEGDPVSPSISTWTAPQLYEGWLKRVMKKINLFDQKVKDFHTTSANTIGDLISLAGQRYEGPIALSDDPEYLQGSGIIEVYETLLDRANSLTTDNGSFTDINTALLFASNRLADLYMLLGNEAYADAADPTIGFSVNGTIYGTEASSIYSFQNQTDSLLEEELDLLRGVDEPGVRPFYNRLVWNFTLGDGEVAYKENYNILDKNEDGEINEFDAMIQFPQGHGDAWGHYLSASKKYYDLLKSTNFDWVPQTENILVAGTPVQVDYRDERKFAKVAAAKANSGAEIVNLTYRDHYTADPEGQWQGYKDIDPDRAWGVDGWARRAGQGAFFDWVTGNAILPAEADLTERSQTIIVENGQTVFTLPYYESDPAKPSLTLAVTRDNIPLNYDPVIYDANNQPVVTITTPLVNGDAVRFIWNVPAGSIQKIDRSTVVELWDVVGSYQSIEAEIDKADAGLNPLGLVSDVVPFDIDPAAVASGETHFEQIYGRAVQAMNNAIAVFNHANESSQLMRRQQDSLADFQRNVENSEADFNNRLIEVFGYPYADDCGPGKTYDTDYCNNGPDLYHYMYVDASKLMGLEAPEVHEFDVLMKNYFDVTAKGVPLADEQLVTFHISTDSRFGIIKPSTWNSSRKAPGELQLARSDLLQLRGRFDKAIGEYDDLLFNIELQAQLIDDQFNLNSDEIMILKNDIVTQQSLNGSIKSARRNQVTNRTLASLARYVGNAVAEAVPTSAGFSTDFGAPARGAILAAANGTAEILIQQADLSTITELGHQQAKEITGAQTSLKLATDRGEFAIKQQLLQIENLVRNEATLRLELYVLAEGLSQSVKRYLGVLAKGDRLLRDRLRIRTQTAAQIQDYRYKDMTFRIFRNDALQKYRAQFDMASMYVYLAAKAYDYETTLLDSSSLAGQHFLTDIVKQRTIGQIENGQPLTGTGLADPMKRLWQNFQILKPQLGFNNPQQETNRFSLRKEMFRITLDTGSNDTWRQALEMHRVDNLWDVPEFRRFMRPFGAEGVPEPGIVIPFSTTVTSGLNFFRWPLGGGDSYYSSSNFATKISSVGVWFSNYNAVGLAQTPRIYLVPVGEDILRTPSYDVNDIRTWKVVDQKLPAPFPIIQTEMEGNPNWIPSVDTLFDEMYQIRRHSNFRAYHDSGFINQSELQYDSRLIGRSVWNTRWLLVIPGRSLLYDAEEGLETFINGTESLFSNERTGNGITDIKLFFETYSYSGN